MKKYLLLFAILSFKINLYSQKESPYFPQEQLIYSNCDEANASACLYKKVGDRVKAMLAEALQKHTAFEDTLEVRISFSVDKKGIVGEWHYASLNDSLLHAKIKDPLKAIIQEFEPFKVIHRKTNEYISMHYLNYNFLYSKPLDSSLKLTLLPDEKYPYQGGVIGEVPVYANCKPKTDREARECFKRSIQAHIRKNFRYPSEALEQGIMGKVEITFIIDKEGYVTNIKTRGGHELLQEEAYRIASLIPRMTPGKQNGEPVRVPYTIPITFRFR